jgi:hypothetical protein
MVVCCSDHRSNAGRRDPDQVRYRGRFVSDDNTFDNTQWALLRRRLGSPGANPRLRPAEGRVARSSPGAPHRVWRVAVQQAGAVKLELMTWAEL